MAHIKSSKPVTKLLYIIIFVSLVVYGICQLVIFLTKPVEIERVKTYTAEDSIKSLGLFFKNETIITSPYSINAEYFINDGDKVARSEKIALLFEEQTDPGLQKQIADTEKKISQFKSGTDAKDLFLTDISKLDSMIGNKINEILDLQANGNTVSSYNEIDELQRLLNKKSVVSGNLDSMELKIKQLEKELNDLKNSTKHSVNEVIAPVAGYFSTGYDGFEKVLNPSDVNKLTVQDIESLIDFKPDSNLPAGYIGKINEDYSWTFVSIVSSDLVTDLSVGDTLYVRFSRVSDESCNAVVKSITSKDDKSILVLESNFLLEIVNSLRKEEAEIIFKKYNGFKVNKNAIRVVDGVNGVFVLKGAIVKFNPVDILIIKDDYAVVLPLGNSSLLPTDDVVIAGKELFDGKIVK